MSRCTERYEDMTPKGRLRVFQQDDGDMIVAIVPDPDQDKDNPGCSVEFCTSGGGSRRTLDALRALMAAMHADNCDRMLASRKGKFSENMPDTPMHAAQGEGHDFVSESGSEFCDKCGHSIIGHGAAQPVAQGEEKCTCPEHGSWYAAEDIDRMVLSLDRAMNGDDAATHPKLCDIYHDLLAHAENIDARPYQSRVARWVTECLGDEAAYNRIERNHRFIEEALELVQACDMPKGDAHALVEYVYGRPKGERTQEVGGVMVTLASLCHAHDIDMRECGEIELNRICDPEIFVKVQAKHAAKPRGSALPIAAQPVAQTGVPEGWREDVNLAAQMLTWGADEGLTTKQEREVREHQRKLFDRLAAAPTPSKDGA